MAVPFGGYSTGASPMHRLDPRVKLLGGGLLISSALLATDWIQLAGLAATVVVANAAAEIELRNLLRDIRNLTPFCVVTIALHAVLGSEAPSLKFTLGLHLSAPGVLTGLFFTCLLYTSPSPRDLSTSRMPSSA